VQQIISEYDAYTGMKDGDIINQETKDAPPSLNGKHITGRIARLSMKTNTIE
jgi:hypothetical protein